MDSLSMSKDETRMGEIPSVQDLEKVESYLNSKDESHEKRILQGFNRGEIVDRLAQNDERLEKVKDTLQGNTFDYEERRGRIDSSRKKIHAMTFEPGEEDFRTSTALRIGGAETGKTMHKKAMSMYQSALENAGYDVEKDTEALQETAAQAMDDMDYRSFQVEIEDSTREAYNETVEKITG